MTMRTVVFVSFMAIAQGANRMPKQYTIEQLMNTVSMSQAWFTPDEKSILVSSDRSGVQNVYSIPVAGGEARQLTTLKESTYVTGTLPDGRFIAYHDTAGNENSHIFVFDQAGKETDLTPGAKAKSDFVGWNPQRTAFYYQTNGRDPRAFDLYRVPVDTLKPELLYKNEGDYAIGTVSPDDRNVVLMKTNGGHDRDLFLFDRTKNSMKRLTPHTGEILYTPQRFDGTGRYLYYTTDDGSEFSYLARYDTKTGNAETVLKEKWDVEYCRFSASGRYRVVAVNADARTDVRIYDEKTGKRVDVPLPGAGEVTGVQFAPSEKTIAFYFKSDRSPADLYVYDFGGKAARRLTHNLSKDVDAADLVDSETIRYRSFDGMEIPALLYKPHQVSANSPGPAIVEVHGGPGGQTKVGYSGYIQYFVNHGYTVLAVNNRGSSGYGKTFFKADDRKHGREPLWDCVEAKNYLEKLEYVQKAKTAILGGSYGGYMVLAALTLKPKEFAAGVDLFGISNWVRTLESMPPYWQSFRTALYEEIGDPSKDREELMAVSPLFHADQIVRPLMVLQGANDPRVIKPVSDEIVAAVRKRGGVAEYVLFEDEGHGFKKKANQMKAYSGILQFLDKYVKHAGPKS
jgi:dipeptidyl aminopeptidase/acylaminoacyl peptidase